MAETSAIENEPFRLICPTGGWQGMIVACPHSGRHYPDSLIRASQLDAMALRRSEDAFVDELFADTPACGGVLLINKFARAYLDVNRGAGELDPDLILEDVEESQASRSPRVEAGLGVVPRSVGDGVMIYPGRIELKEALDRIDEVHLPWHSKLSELTTQAVTQTGQALVLDCHSMPNSASGVPNADIVLGDRFGASCAPIFMSEAAACLKAKGLKVARNNPYAGGYSTQLYGKPHLKAHAIQIEINRSLYMVEGALTKRSGFNEMAHCMKELVLRLLEVKSSA